MSLSMPSLPWYVLFLVFLALSTTAIQANLLSKNNRHDRLASAPSSSTVAEEFASFMKSFNRTYTSTELPYRLAVFTANQQFIHSHNAKAAARGLSYTLGITPFADLTPTEYISRLNYHSPSPSSLSAKCDDSSYSSAVPLTSLDWRQSNAVSPVKDQGQCGACWAFSATGAIEGLIAISKSSLLSLSEQQLLDCSSPEGNEGCSGGYTASAFSYVELNGGICSESEYTYVGYQDSECHDECEVVASFTSHTCVDSLNETALLLAVTKQPVAIAIEADQPVFQHYTGGVINDVGCGTSLNHAILIVGYGKDEGSGQDYWLVKNSWGTKWGLGGYAMMLRGKNICGLASEPTLPLM